MKTLTFEQKLNESGIELGDFINSSAYDACIRIGKEYAIEVSRAALENAANNAMVYDQRCPSLYYKGIHGVSAHEQSITDERNIPKI